jgi:protease-4
MFSRRHPYLFFILIFTSVTSVAIIGLSLLFIFSTRDADFEFGEKVGVIEIIGGIVDSKDTIHNLKRFREDDSVKAIVVRIDSPGGGVGPSQEIFREIRKTSESKKVIASLGGVAASGGYYIAAGADGIVANPGTITGSIGVIMGYSNFQELLEKIGLVPIVIKSGEYKDIGSPVREMTKKEEEILRNLANQIHRQFIKAIAKTNPEANTKTNTEANTKTNTKTNTEANTEANTRSTTRTNTETNTETDAETDADAKPVNFYYY